MTQSRYFGVCPICGLPDKNLSTTKTKQGPIRLNIVQTCDRCQLSIQAEVDHIVTVLRVETYDLRLNLKKQGKLKWSFEGKVIK